MQKVRSRDLYVSHSEGYRDFIEWDTYGEPLRVLNSI
jgi:hypothetical protein